MTSRHGGAPAIAVSLLMYVHAHIRYIEAMAVMGMADAAFQGLLAVCPILPQRDVPAALPRQANAYSSSSDAAFMDRWEASRHFGWIRSGRVGLQGWVAGLLQRSGHLPRPTAERPRRPRRSPRSRPQRVARAACSRARAAQARRPSARRGSAARISRQARTARSSRATAVVPSSERPSAARNGGPASGQRSGWWCRTRSRNQAASKSAGARRSRWRPRPPPVVPPRR